MMNVKIHRRSDISCFRDHTVAAVGNEVACGDCGRILNEQRS